MRDKPPAAREHAHKIIAELGDGGERRAPALTPAVVSKSWLRCASEYGLDPVRLSAPRVVDSGVFKDRVARNEELIGIARSEMDSLHEQIAGSGYALLLTDAQGVILNQRVDPNFKEQFLNAGLIAGADWSERHEGTNGIGTCIMENRPITIHRSEHFRARHISLSCSGSPIHDVAGELIAVLDASCVGGHDTRASQMHTMAMVNMSARVIEKCYFLRRFQHHRVLRFHNRPEFVNLLHDGTMALGEDGRIEAVDNMAVALLALSSRQELIGHFLHEVFDIDDASFNRHAAAAPQALWPLRDLRLGRRYYVSVQAPRSLRQSHPPTLPAYDDGSGAQSAPRLVHIDPQDRRDTSLSLEDLAGDDPQMQRNARCGRRIANTEVSILIQGPTGSGKEAYARALHLASGRAEGPFVAVNCAAIPETLIEAELFGYKGGAFTGARREGSRGRILASAGGTLFLDEIGDMPLNLQTRLLRVLEEREVTPLGGEQPIAVDLRVLAASHRDLRQMVEQRRFREDLFYRLNGITLRLPALRERSDRGSLIRSLLAAESASGTPLAIEREVYELMLRYPWPGNIRELRNVLRTAVAMSEGGVLRMDDLPEEVRLWRNEAEPAAVAASAADASSDAGPANPLTAAERAVLLATIEACQGNMTQTARTLGMSRNTLYRKLKAHRIEPPLRR